MSTLQKRQHYVWRYYLLAWAQGEQIYCTRAPATMAFTPNVANIGGETFFYRVSELDAADLAYLESVIGRSTRAALQDLNRGWIEGFQRSFVVRRLLQQVDLSDAHRAALDRECDVIEKTLAERYHGSSEQRMQPLLDRLREGDASFYQAQSSAHTFIDFLARQYFRTARMRNVMTALPRLLPHNPDRTWPIESFIYATNVASSLVGQRADYHITMLENDTPSPFVTSDQPVINLNSERDENLRLYYPVSPTRALIYHSDTTRYLAERVSVSRQEVEFYNFSLYSRSDSQMYGSNRTYLEELVKLPKDLG